MAGLRKMLLHLAVSLVIVFAFGIGISAEFHRDGQFEVVIPDGWNVVRYTADGERVFVASPEQVSESALRSPEGFELEALLMISVGAIPSHGRDEPLEATYELLRDAYALLYDQMGLTFEVLRAPETISLGDYEALLYRFREDNMLSTTVLMKNSDYLFRLEFGWENEKRDKYEDVFDDIIRSFRPLDPVESPPLVVWRSNVATLPLPAEWHLTNYSNQQSFVSREKLTPDSDLFHVGVTLIATPNYRTRFGVPNANPLTMYQMWLDAHVSILESMEPPGSILDVFLIPVDGIQSLLSESVSDDISGTEVQTLMAATVKDDKFMLAVFEAPTEEFYLYRDIFMESLAQLRWH